VIENDDRLYNLPECLYINQETGILILLIAFIMNVLTQEMNQCFQHLGNVDTEKREMEYLWSIIAAKLLLILTTMAW
jgi:hypothetical protein